MKKILTLFMIIFLSGCINFGEEIETTSPSLAQVERCRIAMHIKPEVELTPLGFKLNASGIDDAIWFKFKTKNINIEDIFYKDITDILVLKDEYRFHYNDDIKWWAAQDKLLTGGQAELPDAKFMNIGIDKTTDGLIIYIMWHET